LITLYKANKENLWSPIPNQLNLEWLNWKGNKKKKDKKWLKSTQVNFPNQGQEIKIYHRKQIKENCKVQSSINIILKDETGKNIQLKKD
jgi:hypothetical protein